ncbi:unnamed protein product [Sphenostylis stenocarpa]|uniref:Uncharacterized protein n=1 Tax=Sphenostylis stenocarpa TaxID=92480 RepID=A0AA86VND3_9FABA|nr:unnamed protein product [Sphenostylis stenocarpa]
MELNAQGPLDQGLIKALSAGHVDPSTPFKESFLGREYARVNDGLIHCDLLLHNAI